MNHLWENVLAQFQLLMTCYGKKKNYQSFVGSNFVVSFNNIIFLLRLSIYNYLFLRFGRFKSAKI